MCRRTLKPITKTHPMETLTGKRLLHYRLLLVVFGLAGILLAIPIAAAFAEILGKVVSIWFIFFLYWAFFGVQSHKLKSATTARIWFLLVGMMVGFGIYGYCIQSFTGFLLLVSILILVGTTDVFWRGD